MDWRMKSKSRSRSRSVSAMDWRSGSRSRSRPPVNRTNNQLETIPDMDASLYSQSAPNYGGFSLADFAAFDDDPMRAFGTGEGGEFLSMPQSSHETDVSQPGSDFFGHRRSLTDQDSFQGVGPGEPVSLEHGPSSSGGEHGRVRRFQMQEAFKAAANSDLFGSLGGPGPDQRNVPFLMGGRKTSWDMSSIGAANSFGAPLSNLGSVPGIGDFIGHSANQHPEYGFLPRLVRKTSFDHKVKERSASPAQPGHSLDDRSVSSMICLRSALV